MSSSMITDPKKLQGGSQVHHNHAYVDHTREDPLRAYGNDEPVYNDIGFSKSSRRKVVGIVVGVVVGLLFAGALAGIIAWLLMRDVKEIPTNSSSVTPASSASSFPTMTTSGGPLYTEKEAQRIDCFPEAAGGVETLDETACVSRGCVWAPSSRERVPWCHVPQGSGFGYRVLSGPNSTPLGFRYLLGSIDSYGIYGRNIDNITFEVEMRGDDLLRFTFDAHNASSPRYRVPWLPDMGSVRARDPRYAVDVYSNDPFYFRVVRTATGTVLFDSGVGGLVFSDRFLQLAAALPSPNLYGLGHNPHGVLRHDTNYRTWPLWARDQPSGSHGGKEYNQYDVHPFYECLETDGHAHGVLLWNSNAMDYTLAPLPMITYKTTGGVLDFFLFLGPSPENVIQQYTRAVGRTLIPPYWSLGFQIGRYGYRNTSEMRKVLQRMQQYDIPMDVQYADRDSRQGGRSFSLDAAHFPDLPAYFRGLRTGGVRSVLSLDPTIEVAEDYAAYTRGRHADVFVEWESAAVMPPGDYEMYNRTDMMGTSPEGVVVFPDFFKTNSTLWWSQQVLDLRQTIPFDGVWLDRSEPANVGTDGQRVWSPGRAVNYTLDCPASVWDDPPYRTKAAYLYDDPATGRRARLADRTLCLQAVHGDSQQYRHYSVHSLYGHRQMAATEQALLQTLGDSERHLVVTRSMFAGDGKYGGKWLGENTSTWADLKLSIIGILEFNLFGISYVGANICGYFRDCPAELCLRWQQLGAFYPYSRNHNHEAPHPQDPGWYGAEVAAAARAALRTRYTLLPHLYTLFYRAHTRGSTVARPLHHEFPTDPRTWGVDEQFLWGAALLISPVLHQGATSLSLYLPPGRWYDFYTGRNVGGEGRQELVLGVTPSSLIPLHVRGGYILTTQGAANNTQYSRMEPFALVVALDTVDGEAAGELYYDNGTVRDPVGKGEYYFARFIATNRRLVMAVEVRGYPGMAALRLGAVQVWGVSMARALYVNGQPHTNYTLTDQILNITALTLPMDTDFTIEWRETRLPTPEEAARVDCCPEGCDVTGCVAKGCRWEQHRLPDAAVCYVDPGRYGYTVSGIRDDTVSLTWKNTSSMFGSDITDIKITKSCYGNILNIKLHGPTARYEAPVPLRLEPAPCAFHVEYNISPFGLYVERGNTGVRILDAGPGSALTFTPQFVQLAWGVASPYVYGLGEHSHPSLLHPMDYTTWPLFARGTDGSGSVMPLLLVVEADGRANGVFIRSSAAMEITLTGRPGLVVRAVGGVLDIFLLLGDGPEHVVQQYNSMLGRPMLPPYWSLGYQLSQRGHDNTASLRAMWERNVRAGIPLDVVHLGDDVYEAGSQLQPDVQRFGQLQEFVRQLHQLGYRTTLQLTPYVASDPSNTAYPLGLHSDVFVKFPLGVSPDYGIHGNDILLGWAMPKGRAVFLDFFKENTTYYWRHLLEEYYRNGAQFDGVWLDRSEPTNPGTNALSAAWNLRCPRNGWDDPVYTPRSVPGTRLSDSTLCMVALHDDGKLRHYHVHSISGHKQAQVTDRVLREVIGKRPLVLSRSMFPGGGATAGHWIGDNHATWRALKQSVIAILEFNMFGVPLVGAGVCGVVGDAAEELCVRWHQVAAFYPLAWNHHNDGRPQDPASWSRAGQQAIGAALRTRYTLLPHLYTLFYRAHTAGSTVARPLHHEFPQDARALRVDEQFLWGDGLLISPVLKQGVDEIYAYFPNDRWFDYFSGEEVRPADRYHLLSVPRDRMALHVRGGHIIPTQQPGNNTHYSRLNPFGLVAAPDNSGTARGDLFWDDGESLDTIANNMYSYLKFSLEKSRLLVRVELHTSASLAGHRLTSVRVFGVSGPPTEVMTSTGSRTAVIQYEPHTQELYINGLDLPLSSSPWIEWQ